MRGRQWQSALLTLVVAALLVTAAIAPAAAQSDEDDDSRLVTVVISIASNPIEFAQGLSAKFSASNRIRDLSGNEPDPAKEADDLQTFLNENNASFVEHTNKVIDERNYSAGNGTYVYELTIDGEDSEETLYVVSTADGTNVTGYSVVNQTDKTVTQSFTITEFQAEDLNEDVREYHETYVTTGDVPSEGYYVQKAVQYGNITEGI